MWWCYLHVSLRVHVCRSAHQHLFIFKWSPIPACVWTYVWMGFVVCDQVCMHIGDLQVCVMSCTCRNGGMDTQVDRGTLCCVHTMCGRGAEMSFLATYM